MYIRNENENTRKEKIKNLFQNLYNIKLNDVKEGNNPVPDFEYFQNKKRIFVMELKTLTPITASKKTGYKKGKFGWWEKKDNSPSKIAKLIKNGHKQLKNYIEPKILAFLNEAGGCDHIDLFSALTGKVPFENSILAIYKHVSDGEIKIIKKQIDLYIWIDPPNIHQKKDFKINFLPTNKIGKNIKEQYFV